MINLLQINLHRSSAAQNLLAQTAAELGSHVLIVSEPNWIPADRSRWIPSEDGLSLVSLTALSNSAIKKHGSGQNFSWLQFDDTIVYSCYNSRNCDPEDFVLFLGELEGSIREADQQLDIIVGGDFNAWSFEWGSDSNDHRGRLLADFAASLDLAVCNVGSVPTYRRVNAASVIDVTFARLRSRSTVGDWCVLEQVYSASDHRYIKFVLNTHDPAHVATPPGRGWDTRRVNKAMLAGFLATTQPPRGLDNSTPSEQSSRLLGEYLTKACDSCMPPRKSRYVRKAAHWWTEEIADLRRQCFRARRQAQRAVLGSSRHAELRRVYADARKELRCAIRESQAKSWAELCRAVDSDPWGLPYRVVTKRIGGRRPGAEARGMESVIADHLFPVMPTLDWACQPIRNIDEGTADGVQYFSLAELMEAGNKLPGGKASGPDGIPNEVLKVVLQKRPDLLLGTYNSCLRDRVFPQNWKIARLVLLHKGLDKPTDRPSSFRPICMLDTLGKLLERLLLERLNQHLDSSGKRSENQFGFIRGRSTVDAINKVLDAASWAATGAVQHRDICVVVSLDVSNAFNSAPWSRIDRALQGVGTPAYLVAMIRSYLQDRKLLVGESLTSRWVTCGVPQGSVLGPTLWNVLYDGLLELQMPPGVQLVAFADDVAVVGIARTGSKAEELMNPVLEAISIWMSENGLKLAPDKSEAVVLTAKKIYEEPRLMLEGHPIPVRRHIGYLGVRLDTRLSFREHVTTVSKKASAVARAIGRLMPNLGGPSRDKRVLLMSVVRSVILYAAPAWARKATRYDCNRRELNRALRVAAIRSIRAYRTVSTEASMFLAGIPPGDLLALERTRIRDRLEVADPTESPKQIRREERAITANGCQARWSRGTSGEWTRRLLPDLKRWWSGSPQPLSFHMTQALTGHGCFRSYLFRMHRASDPRCVYCGHPSDTPEHTLFDCPEWLESRMPVKKFLGGRDPRPEDVIDLLCGPEDSPAELRSVVIRAREAFGRMVDAIIRKKESDEWEAERRAGTRR